MLKTALIILIYLLNAAILALRLRAIANSTRLGRRPPLRLAALSLLLLLDLCFLLYFDCSMRAVVCVAAVACITSLTFPAGVTAPLSRSLGRWRFAVYALSVVTSAALVYIYLPITSFLTSPGEIGIHLGYLLSHNGTSVMVVLYCAGLFYALAASPRMRSLLTFAALCALALGLIYAYVYPFGYPMMNGLMFEQIPIPVLELVLRGLVDIVTVVLVVLLVAWSLVRWRAKRVAGAIVLVNLSLAAASLVSVNRDAAPQSARGVAQAAASRHLLRYSRTKHNVLILLLDRFMGGYVEPIIEQHPELRTALDGFVWYPRTLAAGENSIAGVHPLLGGYDYTPRQMNRRGANLRDLSVESFSILPYNFTRKGYAVNLVNPRGLGFTMKGDCSFLEMPGLNCVHIPATVSKRVAEARGVPMTVLAKSNYADLLVLLGLMRGSPYVARAVLHRRGPWRPFLDHSAGTTFREWAELKSLPELSSTRSTRPNLNIVFNILPHEPYFLGEDCLPRSTRLELPKAEIRKRGFSSLYELQHYNAARCSLRLAADYLRWMTQAGVYDSTTIVIVSDHGIVGPVEDRSSRAVAGGTTDNAYVRTRSVLLVKQRGAHGALRISEAFRPNAEVPRIVCEAIGGCVNPYLGNRTIAAHGRDDPFHVTIVPWQFNLQQRDRFTIVEEHVLVGGDPYNAAAWREVTTPATPAKAPAKAASGR